MGCLFWVRRRQITARYRGLLDVISLNVVVNVFRKHAFLTNHISHHGDCFYHTWCVKERHFNAKSNGNAVTRTICRCLKRKYAVNLAIPRYWGGRNCYSNCMCFLARSLCQFSSSMYCGLCHTMEYNIFISIIYYRPLIKKASFHIAVCSATFMIIAVKR